MNEEELWALESLGHFYLVRDQVERARAIFEATVAIAPERGYPWFALGLIATAEGDYANAGVCYQKAVERSEDPRFRMALAESHLRSQQPKKAEPILRRLVASTDSTLGQRARALLVRHNWVSEAELP